MGIGHRIFVIQNGNLSRISQKTWQAFMLKGKSELKQFANQKIHTASVYYTLSKRQPDEIIRIDSLYIRVRSDGSMDEEFFREGIFLYSNKTANALDPESKSRSKDNNVIDAKSDFDRRRDKNHHPDLSSTVLRKIKIKILGKVQ